MTLLCTGLCRRHKPRTDFRETPWHGRAAACIRCETFPGPAGRSLWQILQDERLHWELEQTREKLRAYRRHVQRLRLQRLDHFPRYVMGADWPANAPLRPWERVMEARRRKYAAAVRKGLSQAYTATEGDFT